MINSSTEERCIIVLKCKHSAETSASLNIGSQFSELEILQTYTYCDYYTIYGENEQKNQNDKNELLAMTEKDLFISVFWVFKKSLRKLAFTFPIMFPTIFFKEKNMRYKQRCVVRVVRRNGESANQKVKKKSVNIFLGKKSKCHYT